MRIFPVAALIACSVLAAIMPAAGIADAAQQRVKGPYNIESDLLTYEKDSDIYHASGNVVITFQNGYAKANSITINKETGDSRAEGNVYLRIDSDILEGELALFNLDEQTGTIYNGRVFFARNHLYLKGDEIEKKGEAEYSLKNAEATTCDGDKPAWRFKARELDVTIDGYGTFRDGSFQVKNKSMLYLPWFIFPAKTTRQTGLLFPYLGYSSNNGADIEIPFFWAISENSDATFYQRYLSERGYKQGVEYRYSPSKSTFGTIYADYIRDQKNTGIETVDSLTRNWEGGTTRWSYYINHETVFSPGFYLRTDLKRVSDPWYFRDFSSFNYYLENYSQDQTRRFQKVSFRADQSLTTLDSTARLVKASGYYNFTALGQYIDDLRLNDNAPTFQRYPELSFTSLRQPIAKTGLNFEMTSIYDYFYRRTGDKGHYGDVYPIVSRPLSFGDYVQLTPFTALRASGWSSDEPGTTPDKQDKRTMAIAGTTASTEAYRIYSFDNKGEGLQKIRHAIKPEINYTFAAVDQGDSPDYVAKNDNTNQLIYSLTNFLTTRSRAKDSKPLYRDVLRVKLTQSFDLKRAREDTPLSVNPYREFGPVALEADVSPFDYLVYHADSAFDQNTGHWIRSNHDIGLKDARGDVVAVGYRYTQGGSLGFNYLTQPGLITLTNPGVQTAIREINLSVKAQATKELNLFYILRRNEIESLALESTYGIEYTQQCWKVLMSYSDTTTDKRIMVVFSLLGLGNVGKIGAPVGF